MEKTCRSCGHYKGKGVKCGPISSSTGYQFIGGDPDVRGCLGNFIPKLKGEVIMEKARECESCKYLDSIRFGGCSTGRGNIANKSQMAKGACRDWSLLPCDEYKLKSTGKWVPGVTPATLSNLIKAGIDETDIQSFVYHMYDKNGFNMKGDMKFNWTNDHVFPTVMDYILKQDKCWRDALKHGDFIRWKEEERTYKPGDIFMMGDSQIECKLFAVYVAHQGWRAQFLILGAGINYFRSYGHTFCIDTPLEITGQELNSSNSKWKHIIEK